MLNRVIEKGSVSRLQTASGDLRKTVAETVIVIMILLSLTGKVCTVLAHHRGAADVLHRHGLHRQAAVGGGPLLLHHSSP